MSTNTAPITPTPPATHWTRRASLRVAAGTFGLLGVVGAGVSIASEAESSPYPLTVTVDVAEDGTRFVFDEAPVFDDGAPAFGNPFVTQGYIYPAGTLTDSNGVNPDGSPEFPDEVIGEWSCRGYFIGEGGHSTEGAWVFTTQLFAFGAHADTGAETIVVTGYEGVEPGVAVSGAITGGTGSYAAASGEASQTLLGFNNPDDPTMGINKTVELELVHP